MSRPLARFTALVLVCTLGCVDERVEPSTGGGGSSSGGAPGDAGASAGGGAEGGAAGAPETGGGGSIVVDPPEPICGDGIAQLSIGEECDPPQDAACPGVCSACLCDAPNGPWRFEDVAEAAGLTAEHGWDPQGLSNHDYVQLALSGGLAVSDFDDDGFDDVYVVGCSRGERRLYKNAGDGTFTPLEGPWDIRGSFDCDAGPLFADLDGDGRDDLFIGGIMTAPRLFAQLAPGTFTEVSGPSNVSAIGANVYGAAAADTDLDGDLDLALGRWGTPNSSSYFVNEQNVFVAREVEAGLESLASTTFTPNFVDMNDDGALDLVFASDFVTSRMFLATGPGTFVDTESDAIIDTNGMGAAIGDYDGDGDFDWFVTSISDPDGIPDDSWGILGNRLYENLGDGLLADVTDEAGVAEGFWAWGACFADFDNDGDLDIFHTNGFPASFTPEFIEDPSRLFLSNGDGTFTERALELGLDDTGQGRGISCFDYDRDGDVDILLQQNAGKMRLFRNNGALGGNWFGVALEAPLPNRRGIGARVEVHLQGETKIGLVRAGSNYASQDPAEVRFGLGAATSIDSITVKRPGAAPLVFAGPYPVNQRIVLYVP